MVDETSSAIQKLTAQLAADNDQAKQDRALQLKTDREMLENLKQDLEQKGIVAEDNQKFRDAQIAQQKAEFDFRKTNATSKAARAEIKKEEQEAFGGYFERFLGKDSSFVKGLSSIGQSLKQKVQGGIAGIFNALKAGAFLLFLGGMVKFLQSPTFKELQDKYLPVIADGLQSLYDTLKSIADGFFVTDPDTGETTFSAVAGLSNIMQMLKDSFLGFTTSLKESFLDENGELTLKSAIAGIPKAMGVLLDAFINPVTGLLLLLAPKMFFGSAVWIGKKLFGGALRLTRGGFGALFRAMSAFNSSLGETGVAMDGKVRTSKKTGAFRKGLGGIAGRFGRLFKFLGKRGLVGLIIGAGAAMATQLDLSKASGVFSNTAKGIGNAFKGLFNVLSDFGSSIAKVASKAAAKAASVVAKSLDDVAKIGAKVIESVVPTKKLSKKQLDALRGTGEFALKPKVTPTVGRDATTGRFTKLSDTQRAALSGTGEFAFDPKVAKAATKTTSELVEKSLLRSLAKKVPLFSLVAGTGFAVDRALKGEYGKAFLEFASGVAGVFPGFGTAGSVAIDAGLLADDLGISVEEAKKLILASGGEVAKAEVKPAGTSKPMNLANVKTYSDYLKVKDQLKINPAYDMDGDGVYNNLEFTNAMQGQRNLNTPMTAGPAFISAPTVNNNQNNIQSSPIVPLDPLMREAISAM